MEFLSSFDILIHIDYCHNYLHDIFSLYEDKLEIYIVKLKQHIIETRHQHDNNVARPKNARYVVM